MESDKNIQTPQLNTVFTDISGNIQSSGLFNITQFNQSANAVSKVSTDSQWDVKNLTEKPMLMDVISWSTSQTPGTVIAQYLLPGDLFNADIGTLGYQILQRFMFNRSSIKIRAQVKSLKFHLGRVTMGWVPLEYNKTQPISTVDQFMLSGYPHINIDASSSSTVELDIPFFHFFNMFSMSSFDGLAISRALGMLYFVVLNPLSASTNVSPAVNISVTGWFSDPILVNPVPNIMTNQLPGKSNRFAKSITLETNVQGLFDIVGSASNIISGASSGVSNFLNGNFSKGVDDWAGALASTEEVVADNPELLSMIFDKPITTSFESSKVQTFSSLCHGMGPDRATRLAICPQSMHIPDKSILSHDVNEVHSINKIASTRMLFEIGSITSSASPGHVVASGAVHPQAFCSVVGFSYQPTYLSYISYPFSFWRGGIKLDVEIVATQFQSALMYLCFAPYTSAPSATLNDFLALPGVFVDISNDKPKEYQFVIPYTNNRMWMRMPLTPISGAFVPEADFGRQSIGTWYLVVVNELVNVDNVPNIAFINFYASAADDYELSVVRDVSLATPQFPIYTLETDVQSGVPEELEPPVEKSEGEAVVLQTVDRSIPIENKHFYNEFFDDLRNYIRRYGNYVMSQQFVVSPTAAKCQAFIPVTPIRQVTGTTASSPNLLSYFAYMYVGHSGSIRYKALPNTTAISIGKVKAVHLFDQYATHDYYPVLSSVTGYYFNSNYALKVTNLAHENALELECPYYSNLNFLQNRVRLVNNNYVYQFYNGTLHFYYDLTQDTTESFTFDLDVYIAAGDDFSFHFPISPPRMQYTEFTNIIL